LSEDAGCDRHAEPCDTASNIGEHQKRTTSDFVNKRGTDESEEELLACIAEGEVVLLKLAVNTCSLESGGLEVRQDG